MKTLFAYLIIIILLMFFSSCASEEEIEEPIPFIPPLKSQLINWSEMNAMGWKNMSFPLWFSPALVDSHNIESVKVKFTNFNFTDSIVNITDTMPHKTIAIDFKENGQVNKLKLTELSNGIQLVQHNFSYQSKIDSFGYTPPTVSSNVKYRKKGMVSYLRTLQELQQYQRLVLQKIDSSVLSYIDKSSKNETLHYFILDSANWNVSYIDRHFNPEGKHIFYYGSPVHYTSSFSLINLVEKSKKQDRFYYPTHVLKSQNFYSDDFITKRTFKYDSSGFLTAFNDSLVTTGNEFLHNEVSIINYEESLPQSIRFFNVEDTLRKNPIKSIRLEYQQKGRLEK